MTTTTLLTGEHIMARTVPKPKPVKGKSASQKNTAGSGKKKPAAKNQMITSRVDIDAMTIGELKESLNRIDFDKAITYCGADYVVQKGANAGETRESIIFPHHVSGKDYTFYQSEALTLAAEAEKDPVGFALKLVAYKRLNKHLPAK
jgi:hypothetical protein